MPVVNANSVDPDQTPHSAASDLGVHCLPVSHLWDARHKWVKGRAQFKTKPCFIAKSLLLSPLCHLNKTPHHLIFL